MLSVFFEQVVRTLIKTATAHFGRVKAIAATHSTQAT